MGKPSKCYRKMDRPAYTNKKYIKRFPDLPEGLRHFTFGNTAEIDFEGRITLVALGNGQVCAKALESTRVAINKELKVLGETKYRLQIKAIPFHIVREHGLVGVAKAERFVKGMRQSFGKSLFRTARVKKGKELIEILIPNDAISFHVSKMALQKAMKKLPHKWKIVIQGISNANIQANPILPKRVKKTKIANKKSQILG